MKRVEFIREQLKESKQDKKEDFLKKLEDLFKHHGLYIKNGKCEIFDILKKGLYRKRSKRIDAVPAVKMRKFQDGRFVEFSVKIYLKGDLGTQSSNWKPMLKKLRKVQKKIKKRFVKLKLPRKITKANSKNQYFVLSSDSSPFRFAPRDYAQFSLFLMAEKPEDVDKLISRLEKLKTVKFEKVGKMIGSD